MPQKSCFRSCLYKLNFCFNSLILILISLTQAIPVSAEEVNVGESVELSNQTPVNTTPRQETKPPSSQPLPEQVPLETLPTPDQLLIPPTSLPSNPEEIQVRDIPEAIAVKKINIIGSTIFTAKDFAKITEKYENRQISLVELFQLRSEITKFYLDREYITTGAFLPPQKLIDGIVEIRVIEGQVNEIKVIGANRLNPNYVRSRLALATAKPLNRYKLLDGLQVLQQNPLIKGVSAELAAGTSIGVSSLEVTIEEAKTFKPQITLDNSRSPAVGSFRRVVQLTEANLLGLGDSISANYLNSDGSNSFDFNYTIPINPRNGTFAFDYGTSNNDITEEPFNALDVESNSRYYEFTLRQPVIQTTNWQLVLGMALTNRESKTTLLNGEVPFPGEGGDKNGRTTVTALRFSQELIQRDRKQVFGVRSQFSIGLDALNSTINNESPDSIFYKWRGQFQWARLVKPDTLFVIRGDLQLTDRPLPSLEQFGLGGQNSVRGYRQDGLLADNGFSVSTEIYLPIVGNKKSNTRLQLIPFIDVGRVWNRNDRIDLENTTLLSTGVALRLQLGNEINAQFDWGIPLISVDSSKNTWQENGLHFSIVYTPFSF
jgi:hemolysin activation/secretion protein